MVLQSWTTVTLGAFQSVWEGFIGYLPNILGAIIVLIVGWVIAVGLQKLITQILRALRIDPALDRAGLGKFFERAGIKMDFAGWIGTFVKWFLIFVFLLAVVDILQLPAVTDFLRSILAYVPNVIAAVLVLLVAVWLANILGKIVQASVSVTNIKASIFLGTITSWSILIFGIFAALIQLGIAPGLLQTIITGLIAMIAIAGGLAFGLGGKDYAAHLMQKLQDEMEGKM